MKGEYKGFLIDYNRSSLKSFVVEDIDGKYETLDLAEKAIDRHLKKNQKIERIKIIKKDGYSESRFVPAEITSVTDNEGIWTITDKGKREMKYRSSFLCEDTEFNREVIKTHLEMKQKAEDLRNEADKHLLTCSRKSIDDLIDKMTVK